MEFEYRILGMERKLAIGLSYLLWPLALIAVLTGRKTINREDRVPLWSSVFCAAVGSIVWPLGVVALVFCILAAIKAFKGQFADATIPFVTGIVDKRVH
ncbi:MAG: hypothetical protein IKZ19_08505 [Clostridia bacterium]|nr:hypothetical protein [Clostridia bacterium]